MSAAILSLVLMLQQTPPSIGQIDQSDTILPEVVVEGRFPEDLAREFVDEVAAPPVGATVARWSEEVCVGAVNVPSGAARFLIDRVSAVAMEVGLDPERPGCRADVVIVATMDGGAIARGLVDRRRNVLAPGNRVQSRSRRDLEAFADVDRPVRWWHISTAVNPMTGRSVVRNLREDNFDSGNIAEVIANLGRPVQPSFIQSTVRQDLRRAVIIIDFDEIGDDIDFDQLADYVAFVALAQVDPEADTSGFSTILNLFDDPTTPGLTEWDRAYLWGLYNSDDTARGDAAREAALRREMLRAREQGAAPTAE